MSIFNQLPKVIRVYVSVLELLMQVSQRRHTEHTAQFPELWARKTLVSELYGPSAAGV